MTSSAPTTRPLYDWEGYLYVNVGTYATPSLWPMPNIRGVETPDKMDEDDVTVRAGVGNKWYLAAARDQELSFIMPDVAADPTIALLRGYYFARTLVEFFSTNYLITDTNAVGWRCVMQIVEFTKVSPDGKSQYWQVKCRPSWAPAETGGAIVGASTWTIATAA